MKADLATIHARTIPGENGCLLWTGPVSKKGQPRCHIDGRGSAQVRRVVWALFTGDPPPPKMWVGVTCGVQACLNPDHLLLRYVLDDPKRFWSLVKKADGDACWEWTSATDVTGYPVFMRTSPWGTIRGNRMAWELTHGLIGDATMFVCHHCDNPLCVRPDHLFLGTAKDNNADMWTKGRGWRGGPRKKAS
jgi:hypothetical protein